MEQVGKQVGQTFVIENRPGAGGTIGANMVAKAAPDGYTILVYGAIASRARALSKLPYDTLNDFIRSMPLGQQPLVVVDVAGKGYKTLGDLVAAGKGKARRAELFDRGRRARPRISAPSACASAPASRRSTFRSRARPKASPRSSRAASISACSRHHDHAAADQATASSSRSPSARTSASLAARRADHDRGGLPPIRSIRSTPALYLPAKTPRDIVEKLHDEIAKALRGAGGAGAAWRRSASSRCR